MSEDRERRIRPRPLEEPAAATVPSDAAEQTTGASLFGGGIWQLASRLWPQVTTLVLSVVVARFLGPDDFGRQSFIAFVSVATISFFSGGLSVAVMRFVAELLGRREKHAIPHLVRWCGGIQLAAAAIGGGVLLVTGALGAEPPLAWVLAGLATAISILQTIPHAVLIATQRFRTEAVIGLWTDAFALVATVAVLVAGGGIVGIFAVQVVVTLINLVRTTVAARSTLRTEVPRDKPEPGIWRPRLVRFVAYETGGTLLTLIIWRRSEFFFLEAYSTDAQIGLFSIAFAAMTALVLVPQTLAAVLTPAFATLFGAGRRDRLETGYGRAMRILLLIALPLTTATAALAPTLLEVVYGEEFAEAGTVLLVMIALFPLLPIYHVSSAMLTGLGKVKVPLVIGIAAAIVNIALDFLLIPKFDAIGAALATTIAQMSVVLPLLLYTNRLVGRPEIHLGPLVRTTVAAFLAGAAALWLVSTLDSVPALFAGSAAWLAVFMAAALTLGVLAKDDAEWVAEATSDRAGGRIARLARALATNPRDRG